MSRCAAPYEGSLHLASPASNQQISEELYLSLDAVKANLRAMYQLFGVARLPQNQKRAQLAERAITWGWSASTARRGCGAAGRCCRRRWSWLGRSRSSPATAPGTPTFGRNLELQTIDARFGVRGTQKPWPGVVVVGIDDQTLETGCTGASRFGRRWDAR